MREFIHHFLTNRRWFLGTIVVLFVIFMFFWRLTDPVGFIESINDFFQTVWGIIQSLLIITIAILGIRIILGHRPWWTGGKKKN